MTISDGTEDPDATTVSIVATDAVGSEPGTDDGLFTVTLARGKVAPPAGITVSYTVSGSATAGTDYTALAGTVSIPAGASSATIPVDVLNDDVVEGPESVIVTLSDITSGDPQISIDSAGRTATVTISDDDTATVSIAQVSDGAEGGVPSHGKFQVTLSRVSSTDTVLSYTVGGTATPGAGDDYTPLGGTVTIAAGTTIADIDVAVLDDDLVEGPETVTVTLSAVSSGNPGIAIHDVDHSATLSIIDDETATVSIAKLADGAEAGPVNGKFQVSQSLASSTDTVVSYTVTGTATPGAGEDYTPLSGTVTIVAGTLSADIDVAVLNDALVESTETVVVTLTIVTSGAPEITINNVRGMASLDILDDDEATVSILRIEDGAEGAPAANGRFRVTLTKASDTDTVLSYTVAGTASPGDANDYLPLAGTVTIAAGTTTADIVVFVQNDLLVEPAETVIVTVSAVTGGDSDITIDLANRTATVSILDEPATVSVAARTVTVAAASTS